MSNHTGSTSHSSPESSPQTIADSREWVHDAECRRIDPDTKKPIHDPELWYPVSDVDAKAREKTAVAIAICYRCGVREECLAWAVGRKEQHGTWGGRTQNQRVADRRRELREAERKRNPPAPRGVLVPVGPTRAVVLAALDSGHDQRDVSAAIGANSDVVRTVRLGQQRHIRESVHLRATEWAAEIGLDVAGMQVTA